MRTPDILNALIHSSDGEKFIIAQAIEEAYDKLKEVRTGEDFECECHGAADDLAKSLGLNDESNGYD
jgi:hypothetical protein